MGARAVAWRGRAFALAAGVAAGLAHPPFGLAIGILGYGLLLRMSDTAGDRPLRSAFFRGWLAGVGYFGLGVAWITEPFMVDAAVYGWMAPFALLLMGGGLALFWGLGVLLYRTLAPKGAWRVLAFAACLAGAEWLRGHVLTGFPWNLPGESWRAGSAPSQAAALIGTYGLSWLTIAIGAAPALVLDKASRWGKAAPVLGAAAALVALYAFGGARLATPAGDQGVRLRIVQANVDQKEKWRPENLQAIFDGYVALSRTPTKEPAPDVIIWPEGALPAVIDELLAPGSSYITELSRSLGPDQALVMGANRVELAPEGGYDYFNSLVAFGKAGSGLRVLGVYDKHRLVPFGEFLPFGEVATKIGVRSLVHMPEDFSFGPPPRPLAIAGLPLVQPLICYEALFPRVTSRAARGGQRPTWMLNISNDAWFGQASGPLQHLNIASYRAIEEGLPIVRSTPTGVSAVIDAFGRTVSGASLGLGEAGVIDADLPAALPPTPYALFGDAIFGLLLLVSVAPAIAARLRRR